MKNFIQALKELQEEKPGLWANIRAKRARGEKPAHKNSNAHKDAVKAGKKIKATSEARVDRDVAERIEGMLSIPLKRKFLDSFLELYKDLTEEDPFYAEDVINHLNNEMHKELKS